jgi:hypothetical protein
VLIGSIAVQLLEVITWRHCQLTQLSNPVQLR